MMPRWHIRCNFYPLPSPGLRRARLGSVKVLHPIFWRNTIWLCESFPTILEPRPTNASPEAARIGRR
jgi:hypothetical protein